MTEATPLPSIIGEQLRFVRGPLRQVDVAEIARRYGLNWRRATVAAVEAGHRTVTLEELLLLSMAFHKPLYWWVAGNSTLGAGMEMVQLTPDASGPKKGVVALLRGESLNDLKIATDRRVKRAKGLEITDWELPEAGVLRAMQECFDNDLERARLLWPEVEVTHMADVRVSAQKDAEMKAAKRLGITPFEVAVLAVKLWGHGLTEERDRLLASHDREGDSPRTHQARRGHVTRDLLHQLEKEMGKSNER